MTFKNNGDLTVLNHHFRTLLDSELNEECNGNTIMLIFFDFFF